MRQKTLLSVLFFFVISISHLYASEIRTHVRLAPGAHTDLISRLSTDSSQTYILSASVDKSAILWDGRTGNRINVFYPPQDNTARGCLYAAALRPDASIAAFAGLTYTSKGSYWIYLVDPFNGRQIGRIGPCKQPVSDLLFTEDGKHLIVSFYYGGLRVYDINNRHLVASASSKSTIYNVASSSRTGIIAASKDGSVTLHSRNTFARQTINGGDFPAYALSISPRNREAAVSYTGTDDVRIIDLLSGGVQTIGLGNNHHKDNLSVTQWLDHQHLVTASGPFGFQTVSLQIILWQRNYAFEKKKAFTITAGAPTDIVTTGKHSFVISTSDARLIGLSETGVIDFDHRSPVSPMSGPPRVSTNAEILDIVKGRHTFRLDLSSSEFSPASAINNAHSQTDRLSALLPMRNSVYRTPGKYDSGLQLSSDDYQVVIKNSDGELIRKFPLPVRARRVMYAAAAGQIVAYHQDGLFRWYRISDGQLTLSACFFDDFSDWLAWTPAGYWSGTADGDSLLQVLIHSDNEQIPIAASLADSKQSFYSPQRIARAARGETFSEKSILNGLTPHVRIDAQSKINTVSESLIVVRLAVWSPPECGLSDIRLTINGKKTPAVLRGIRPLRTGETIYSYQVKLIHGDNFIEARAQNCNGESSTAATSISFHPKPRSYSAQYRKKPGLYILSIGISTYENPTLRLSYAAKDAKDFTMTVVPKQSSLYSTIRAKTYTDREAERDSILQAFEWLSRNASSQDVTMIFMAGHGVTDNHNRFYFLPHNAEPEHLFSTGISDDDLEAALVRIPGKVICFLDACYAGGLHPGRRSLSSDTEALIREINGAAPGVILFSSSMKNQVSEELSQYENGAFSRAVIEAFQGHADFTGGGYITVNMVEAYISERVKKLTDGRQNPVTTKPPGMRDYPLAVIGGE